MQPSPSRRRPVRAAALLVSSTIALVGFAALPASAAPGDVSIDVYTINDFHGHLEQNLGSGEAGAADAGSAANNISGSPFISQALDDEPTIDVLNQMGLSVSAIGNHEFDHGRTDLDGRVAGLSDFEYISANLYETGTTTRAYAPYQVQTIGGVRVGFVSAVTEDLPSLVSPDGIASLDVGSIVDGVNSAATELRDGIDTPANPEADVVVLLVHEGAASATDSLTDTNTVFGRIVTGTAPNVDAIASAHTHNLYAQAVTVGTKTIPVLQTGSYGTNLGHLNFQVNPTSKQITASSAVNIRLVTPAVTGGAAAAAVYAQDPEVAAIVAAAKAESSIIGRASIGSITESFTRATQTDVTKENRGGESTLGNVVADGQLATTQDLGTQIAFMNPGGLRTNITFAPNPNSPGDTEGNVTYEEAATVQPFANTLITQTLTGAQIKTVLEQQWQTGQTRPFLKLGISADLTYTYDPAAADGSHVTEIFYQGEPIAVDDTFKVVTNSFLAAGGDGFLELAQGQGKADTGRVDLDAFVTFIGGNSPLQPDYASRSIGIANVASPGTPVDFTGAEAGSSYEFALSSLLLSGAPTPDTEVSVLFDGVEIATAPIDPSIVDTYDEQGRATVAFSIPADAADGQHEITFQLAEAGLALRYPVQIGEVVVDPGTPGTPGAPGAPGTPGGSAVTPAAQATLAATGVDATVPLFASGLLLAVGALVLLRRRRASQASA
jgi:5'-nucleotidase